MDFSPLFVSSSGSFPGTTEAHRHPVNSFPGTTEAQGHRVNSFPGTTEAQGHRVNSRRYSYLVTMHQLIEDNDKCVQWSLTVFSGHHLDVGSVTFNGVM